MLPLFLALVLVATRITQPAPVATASFGGGYATIQEDGTPLTQRTTLNFVGSTITCADTGGITVCTLSSGAPGSANFVEAEVDFGASGDTTASVVVAASWVGATSTVVCAPTAFSTTDSSEGMEDAVIEGLTATPHTRSAGVGFSLLVSAAAGRAIGKFKIHCTGG